MTVFPFNVTVPAANNNPSADQNPMRINNVSTNDILAVDHITFEAENGGTHKQTAFSQFSLGTLPPAITSPQPSVAYPAAGVAANTVSQYYFRNFLGNFLLSSMRAYALCNGVAGGIVASQQFNVVSVIRTGTGQYTVTLVANSTSTINYSVFISARGNQALFLRSDYNITGISTFTLAFLNTANVPTDPVQFSFQVLQI